jgi:rubrerythrin
MTDDVRECLEILDKAVEFEETGMSIYLEHSEKASSQLERNLFRSLAEDEKQHKAYLLGIKAELLENNNPDDMQPRTEADSLSARQVFESALENASDPYQAEASELEIIQGAMDVERKGFVMYSNAVETVQSERARDIFQHLAEEEQRHYSLLKNTYDYLADPEGWHGFDESPMLDGG